jgi:DNA-binding IclR family transcriptional regulator
MDISDDRSTPAQPGPKPRREETGQPRSGAQSVRRAIAVLRILAAGREAGLSLSDVVKATGLSRPTAHRIVNVLVEEGIAEQRHKTKRYAIGHQVLELALARPSRSSFAVMADPHLAELARTVGDTAFLTIRTGMDALCVARVIGTYPVQVLSIEVGARRPLGVSSAGVMMLADLPPSEAREIIEKNANRFDGYRTSPASALEQVAVARRNGYAVHHAGLVPGTKAISAAIKAPDGRPCAAITIAAINARLRPQREAEVGETLKSVALTLESHLKEKGKTSLLP